MFEKTRVFSLASAAVLSTAISVIGHHASAENLNLSASIDTGCTIGTDNLAFGVIDSTNGGSATGAQISLTNCLVGGSAANQSATVKVDGGTNVAGPTGKRQLKHDTLNETIEYTLTETANSGGDLLPNDTFLAGISGGSGALVFDATILGTDVSGKSAGTYLDAVGITVSFI